MAVLLRDKQKIYGHPNPYTSEYKREYHSSGGHPTSLPCSGVKLMNQLKVPNDRTDINNYPQAN
jgi:hypothetical protein